MRDIFRKSSLLMHQRHIMCSVLFPGENTRKRLQEMRQRTLSQDYSIAPSDAPAVVRTQRVCLNEQRRQCCFYIFARAMISSVTLVSRRGQALSASLNADHASASERARKEWRECVSKRAQRATVRKRESMHTCATALQKVATISSAKHPTCAVEPWHGLRWQRRCACHGRQLGRARLDRARGCAERRAAI